MLQRKLQTPFRVLKAVHSPEDEGGSSYTTFVPQNVTYGVVSRRSTSTIVDTNSEILSREKQIRVFQPVSINYEDKILLNGEVWLIDGQPETLHSARSNRRYSTVIAITKEGLDG